MPMHSAIAQLNNALTKARRKTCRPERLLLLFPSCLQYSKCKQNIRNDLGECKRCGRCKVKDILELAEEYGVVPFIATGGRLAAQKARSDDIDAIVAVACRKELRAGVLAVFPKAALAVHNSHPHGPCVDTDVDLAEVRNAIEWFLR